MHIPQSETATAPGYSARVRRLQDDSTGTPCPKDCRSTVHWRAGTAASSVYKRVETASSYLQKKFCLRWSPMVRSWVASQGQGGCATLVFSATDGRAPSGLSLRSVHCSLFEERRTETADCCKRTAAQRHKPVQSPIVSPPQAVFAREPVAAFRERLPSAPDVRMPAYRCRGCRTGYPAHEQRTKKAGVDLATAA